MLSQVEQGQANPSLVTVDKLARALGTDFAALAGAGDSEPIAAGRPTEVWRSAAGGSATLHVTGARVGGPELWEWTLAPGDVYRAEPDPPGSEELLLVLAGTLTLELRESHVVLAAGASGPALASDRAYAYANRGDAPARFARVVQIAGARRPDRLSGLTMPRQNRVTPLGELIADPARGLVYGNRGCLHDAAGRIRRGHAGAALDRVPAALPRLAPRAAAAARPLHRAVLPRRGDRVRRRPPPVRAVPPRRLRPLPGADRRAAAPTRSTCACTPSGSTAAPAPPRTRRTARTCPTARSCCATTARRGSCAATRCCAGRPRATPSGAARPRGAVALLTPPTLVGVLRADWDGAVPLLHPSAG